jgi:hypothetical protein
MPHELVEDRLSETTELTQQEVHLLKMIICSGLYPNVALPDEDNIHRKSNEQIYHTPTKNFVLVHPSSVYSIHYETMMKQRSSSKDSPTFHSDWEFLCYIQLLEISKPYLINTIRVPGVHTCLLFSKYSKYHLSILLIIFISHIQEHDSCHNTINLY